MTSDLGCRRKNLVEFGRAESSLTVYEAKKTDTRLQASRAE